MMKVLKCAVLLSLLVVALSCRESLPEDQSRRFAATVASDLYKNSFQLPLVDISTMHKASTWLDNIDDQSAQHEIEDLYLSKIAPRVSDNSVAIISSVGGIEIPVEHNNLPIIEVGTVWSISADYSASSKKITITNIDGEQWLCTQEEPNGDISISYTVKWSAIDNYTFTMEGDSDTLYENSPVAAQHFYSTSIMAAKVLYAAPYPIETPLTIIDGSLTIELLDAAESVIEADDIDVTFQEVGSASSPYYNNYYNTFNPLNPLIVFRGNSFYYSDLYSLYYYD